MVALETAVRAIEIDGLHWGASKLIPVAYGVKKLQIMLTIEDALVSSDDIEVYSVTDFFLFQLLVALSGSHHRVGGLRSIHGHCCLEQGLSNWKWPPELCKPFCERLSLHLGPTNFSDVCLFSFLLEDKVEL